MSSLIDISIEPLDGHVSLGDIRFKTREIYAKDKLDDLGKNFVMYSSTLDDCRQFQRKIVRLAPIHYSVYAIELSLVYWSYNENQFYLKSISFQFTDQWLDEHVKTFSNNYYKKLRLVKESYLDFVNVVSNGEVSIKKNNSHKFYRSGTINLERQKGSFYKLEIRFDFQRNTTYYDEY